MTRIRVDGRLIKRDRPAIIVEQDLETTHTRRAEIWSADILYPGRMHIGTVIQRGPDEEGPNGARVWIELEDDVEVLI